MSRYLPIAAITTAFATGHAVAVHAENLEIPVPAANAQHISVDYQCEKMDPMKVVYINAGPNSLAVVPVDGERLVFAAVISGSGVRYAAGPYIWWSHQGGATLDDIRKGEDAAPVQCRKID